MPKFPLHQNIVILHANLPFQRFTLVSFVRLPASFLLSRLHRHGDHLSILGRVAALDEMLSRADCSRLRGPFSEGTLLCTPVMKTASIGNPSEQSRGDVTARSRRLVLGQPSAGRGFGDPIDREVSQSRQDRAKIVADWNLESLAGFDDLRL
jgi:hypothetical protein